MVQGNKTISGLEVYQNNRRVEGGCLAEFVPNKKNGKVVIVQETDIYMNHSSDIIELTEYNSIVCKPEGSV